MRYIETLREGERINEVYLCKNKQASLTKAGKPFVSLILQDKTGTLDGKVWDPHSSGISDYEEMDFIEVYGEVIHYNNNLQLNIKQIRVAREDEYSPADYMPTTDKSTDKMYEELLRYIGKIGNPYLKRVLEYYFVDDKAFIKKFNAHSAAKSVHHGFSGGLLEHTLSVVKFCEYMAGAYPILNRDLLISMAGLLFSVFLAFVPAMPGWFIWVVPFFMLYLAGLTENRAKMVMVYAGFNVLYLGYYLFFHVTQFTDLSILGRGMEGMKQTDDTARNIVFTLMVGIFLILVVSMYLYGVNSNSFYRRRSRPFTIGIAGDSGAGKSRLLVMLAELLSEDHILNIEGDGDHRWERGDANWKEMTHLNPRANYLYRQAEDLRVLRGNNAVKRADYDHITGTFTAKRKLTPRPYIIMCGLHSLYLPQMRQVLDMKIYLDTDEALRCYWKLGRDQGDRGHGREEVMTQIEKRRVDAEKYIYPQKQYADLVIRYFDEGLAQDGSRKDGSQEAELGVEFLMDVRINAEPILALLQEQGVCGQLSYDDLQHQSILFRAEDLRVDKKIWEKVAHTAIIQIEDLAGNGIVWEDGVNGAVQLMLMAVIGEIMQWT